MKNNVLYKYLALASFAMFILLLAVPAAIAQGDIIPDSSKEVAAADTQAPADVENVAATAGDKQVVLNWDMATDNVAVKGFKIYYGTNSVTQDGGEYNLGAIDVGNKITYTITGLDNDQTYYFAITAYDEAGNESENYSYEVSAKPVSGTPDTEAPTVVKAEATDKYTVTVTFSEPVTLPATDAQTAFGIKEDVTNVALEVLAATLNKDDSTGKSVLLTTALQKKDANYVLTAGIDIKDTAGNPIESGTSDTALFKGTDLEPKMSGAAEEPETTADTVAPILSKVTVSDSTHIVLTFSEPVVLGDNPVTDFLITEEQNLQSSLNILKAELSTDNLNVTLTTDPQKTVAYNLIVLDVVKDLAGNSVDSATSATVFNGSDIPAAETTETTEENHESATDSTAPEDATNLAAKLVENMIVNLSWTPSLNTAGDLANYILYKSTDGTVYGDGVILKPSAASMQVSDLKPGIKYFFKLAAKDAAGNESDGAITQFVLPATGPELALFALISLGAGKLLKRKNKK